MFDELRMLVARRKDNKSDLGRQIWGLPFQQLINCVHQHQHTRTRSMGDSVHKWLHLVIKNWCVVVRSQNSQRWRRVVGHVTLQSRMFAIHQGKVSRVLCCAVCTQESGRPEKMSESLRHFGALRFSVENLGCLRILGCFSGERLVHHNPRAGQKEKPVHNISALDSEYYCVNLGLRASSFQWPFVHLNKSGGRSFPCWWLPEDDLILPGMELWNCEDEVQRLSVQPCVEITQDADVLCKGVLIPATFLSHRLAEPCRSFRPEKGVRSPVSVGRVA